MSDTNRNVRVSFKLSREAAIKLREIALTKSELLCNIGVLAVQLGNESQICISSALNFDKARYNEARKRKPAEERTNIGHVECASELGDGKKIPEAENGDGVKALSNVDREMRAVEQVVTRAAVASVKISSDGLPSTNSPNKAPFMRKTSTQENNTNALKVDAKSSQDTDNTTPRTSLAQSVSSGENPARMKSASYNGVIKFNAKDIAMVSQNVDSYRNALYAKSPAKIPRDEGCDRINEIQDDTKATANVNMDNISSNAVKFKAKDTTASQEANANRKTHAKTPGHNSPKLSHEIDSKCHEDRTERNGDSSTTIVNLDENDMTDTIECNANSDINSSIPTFPGHGISFAQHLINLSKQHRLENEKSPNGLSSEKFFEPSRIVRNDHVLRSFTTGNEKQEDFMGFSGNNALLFECNYSATAVKTAEELSKEQSEASPTNLDSMSETSADSLFEDARLGSVDELSLSPSSIENVPISSEDNSTSTSPCLTEKTQSDNVHSQPRRENHRRKRNYQRHLKGHSGIVCKLCMHPVQKSYSCYKLAHAPKEIRHLFEDGSNCVRVCRRCLPYKSPKSSEKNTPKQLHKKMEQRLK